MQIYQNIPVPHDVLKAPNFLDTIFNNSVPNKNILSCLGSYWVSYFEGYTTVANLSTGVVTLFTKPYMTLLNSVINSYVYYATPTQTNLCDLLLFKKSTSFDVLLNNESYIAYKFDDIVTGSGDALTDINLLQDNLFGPVLKLIKGYHFIVDIENKQILFKINIFEDPDIISKVYYIKDPVDTIVFMWVINPNILTYDIYNRYGMFLYEKEEDSAMYGRIITLMQFFSTNTKKIKTIETVINALMGIPFTSIKPVTILSISVSTDATEYIIVTDREVFRCPTYTQLSYQVGDTVPPFTIFAKFILVYDWVINPDWIKHTIFPTELIDNFENFVATFVPYNMAKKINNPDFFKPYYDVVNGVKVWHPNTEVIQDIYNYNSATNDISITGMAKEDGNVSEYYLYRLLYHYLKYNLIKFDVKLPLDLLDSIESIKNIYFNIIKGNIPVYLYPIFEIALHTSFLDVLSALEDKFNTMHLHFPFLNDILSSLYGKDYPTLNIHLNKLFSDNLMSGSYIYYNGIPRYDPTLNLKYGYMNNMVDIFSLIMHRMLKFVDDFGDNQSYTYNGAFLYNASHIHASGVWGGIKDVTSFPEAIHFKNYVETLNAIVDVSLMPRRINFYNIVDNLTKVQDGTDNRKLHFPTMGDVMYDANRAILYNGAYRHNNSSVWGYGYGYPMIDNLQITVRPV